MLLMIDNYDSFTYNLVQYLGELGEEVRVVRNDEITLDEHRRAEARSASSCRRGRARRTRRASRSTRSAHFAGQLPILGVCLGPPGDRRGVRRQGRARERRQCTARPSADHARRRGVFRGLPEPFHATTRYHSLVIERDIAARPSLEVTAWTDDGEIMGVRHKRRCAVEGVQFHPESILTEHGHALLRNFLERDGPHDHADHAPGSAARASSSTARSSTTRC